MELTLLVLAAGMGSRYGGLKQLDGMGPEGEIILDYSVFDALQAGFSRVVFVIRRDFEQRFREEIGARFAGQIEVAYAFQEMTDLPGDHVVPPEREKPWGTAHAVYAARKQLPGPFAVINADDFYGGEAFAQLADFFREDPSPAEGAMVAYPVERTLSAHGAVSRGVCSVDAQGRLQAVEEHRGIFRTDGKIISEIGPIEAGTLVSMNCWGLSAGFLPLLEEQLHAFLSAHGSERKSECYLPAVIDHGIRTGRYSIDVRASDDDWCGVTYQDDRPAVTALLAEKARAGVYPSPLWHDAAV